MMNFCLEIVLDHLKHNMDMKELDMMGEPTANSWTSRIGDYLDCVIIYACMYVVCVLKWSSGVEWRRRWRTWRRFH